ncbi:MAG: hypothetical protein H7Y10_10945 [Flavobacterium sp.]|nr:hypothetical protein [Flavobacterium sp.]
MINWFSTFGQLQTHSQRIDNLHKIGDLQIGFALFDFGNVDTLFARKSIL